VRLFSLNYSAINKSRLHTVFRLVLGFGKRMLGERSVRRIFFISISLLSSLGVYADQTVEERLNWFLNTVSCEATHQSFWAEDLVYTSSSGSRFGKASIVDGMNGCDELSVVRYAADEVTVRMVGTTALLSFKLLMFDGESELPTQSYYNSGVLVKNDGVWQATLWQATIIPNAVLSE